MAEKDVKTRVQKAMKEIGISAYAIAKSCSINERTIYQQTSGGSKLGVETIEALLHYKPELSAEWIFRGAGKMLYSDSEAIIQPQQSETEAELRDMIRRQQREIDGLYERIAELKRGGSIVPQNVVTA